MVISYIEEVKAMQPIQEAINRGTVEDVCVEKESIYPSAVSAVNLIEALTCKPGLPDVPCL